MNIPPYRYLSSDLVYVVLFPQLLAIIYWPSLVDTYGCLAGYFVAVVLRVGGEYRSHSSVRSRYVHR